MAKINEKPLLFSIPLDLNRDDRAIVIVHRHQACTPPERLISVLEFADDGRGGYISAAQTSDKRWGYINQSGHWVVAPMLENARSFSDDGLARFQQDGRWGYVNTAGETVIAAQFEEARAFACGLAAVRVGKDQWRFIDLAGEFAFDKVFFAVGDFSPAGLAAAAESRKKMLAGYIDRTGQWAIKPQFKTSLAFSAGGVAPASTDRNKYGLIDLAGNWVLPPAYPDIREFNEDGLAYFDEENSWDNGHGYLNAKGEVVLKGERHFSKHMVGGIVSTDYAGREYLNKDGQTLPSPRLSWGGHFNEFAYAVVRAADFIWSDSLKRHEPLLSQWGLLHADGSFRPAAAEALEPLTDADGWIPGPLAGTPLTAFLTSGGQIVFLDRDGVAAFRIRYDDQATLFDAQDTPLWQSDIRQACRAPAPFFHRPIDSFLDGLTALEEVVPCAESMLVETEEKLHCFAVGKPVAARLHDGGDTEEDDEDDSEDDDEDAQDESSIVTARRLVRAYVGEEHNGYYEFLGSVQGNTVTAAKTACLNALQARFGEPDPDPEHASRRHRYFGITSAWPVKLQQAIAGASSPLSEARELWLGFYAIADSGDGDAWHELWLMCAPSIDALETARRARSLVAPTPTAPHTGIENADQAPSLPQTYDEWLAAACQDKSAIAHVPLSLIDDAMVDAAVETNVEALESVPAQWQTSARLDALIRKGVTIATGIPPQCMTAEGLALARALYGEDPDWQWRDERNSQLPSQWTKNCLYSVWAGLLTEEHCLRAVSGGEALRDLPHWLRTDRVEQAALDADIYNISYIARDQVTPELAARAVRHDYGKLIEHIPEALLTPQLCLKSARTNGLSLEYIPIAMRGIEVCVAAMQDDSRAFSFVPDEIRLEVYSRLIDADLAKAREEKEERIASRWHGYRAWTRLKRADYEGAIVDATLAVDGMRYAQTAHYVLASAYRALGRKREAALEASTVLSLEDPYTAEFDSDEDTAWLKTLTEGQFDDLDDAALIAQIQSHPRALADIPRARLTHEMIAIALAADPGTIEFVPKRLMTAERYAIALRERTKGFDNIPKAMLSEEIYIEHVRDSGYRLEQVPMEWRTAQVCAYALNDTPNAQEHVPESVRQAAQEAMKTLTDNSDDEYTAPGEKTASWLDTQVANSLLSDKRNESVLQRGARKILFTIFVAKTMLSARSDAPHTLTGVAGWMVQRPFATLMINAVFAIVAMICHFVIAFGAWRAEGVWVGLATGVLMGFAEIYWAWRFLFSDPGSLGLGIAAIVVMAYVFIYRRVHAKVVKVIAEK